MHDSTRVVRTTSERLTERLGEPDHMDVSSARGATHMSYKLAWNCGCRAEGTGTQYSCRPCRTHNAIEFN